MSINKLHYVDKRISNSYIAQHLHIVSDGKIQEGDWFVGDIVSVKQCTLNNAGNINFKDGWYSGSSNCKKIIATTDISLLLYDESKFIKNSPTVILYPQPSEEFVKEYVESYNKGEVITEVLVEYEEGRTTYEICSGNPYYTTEFNLKVNSNDNTINIKQLKPNKCHENK